MADRLSTYNQDAEVDRRVAERLENAGFKKPEDLQTGRADVGMATEMLGSADPQIAPLLAEKEMRDAQWKQQATGIEQPAPAPSGEGQPASPKAPTDRLSQLQSQLDQAMATEKQWKQQAGDDRNRVGELKKRLQELEHSARNNGGGQSYSQPQPQFQYQQPVAPTMQYDGELTQQGVMNLMLAQSQAFGQQLAAAKAAARQEMIEISRGLQGYTLTSAQEADLQESNPWLLSLPHGEREKAMMSLVTANTQNQPSSRSRTAARTDEAEARGQVRTFQYVEPSSQGSPQEVAAAEGQDSALEAKAAKVRELLNTPGKAAEAEALINDITPGGRRD